MLVNSKPNFLYSKKKKYLSIVVDRIMASNVLILIARTLNMLFYGTEWTLKMWLRLGSWDRKIILEFEDESHVISRIHIRGRWRASQRRCEDRSRGWSDTLWIGLEPRNADGLSNVEKARKGSLQKGSVESWGWG